MAALKEYIDDGYIPAPPPDAKDALQRAVMRVVYRLRSRSFTLTPELKPRHACDANGERGTESANRRWLPIWLARPLDFIHMDGTIKSLRGDFA